MNIQDALLRGLVPAGRPDAGVPARPLTEADFARSYVGYFDLFGVQPPWDSFFERLQDLGLQPTMAALSFLNSWMYLKGGIQAQAEIIGSTFDLDLQSRLLQLPDLDTRVAYSPAQTLLVMRSALLYSPDRADTRSNEGFARALTEVLLMANDLLTVDERAKIDAAAAGVSDPEVLARAMLSFSIRTTVVNGADAYNTTLARASIILRQLATRDDVRQRAAGDAIDIAARFGRRAGCEVEHRDEVQEQRAAQDKSRRLAVYGGRLEKTFLGVDVGECERLTRRHGAGDRHFGGDFDVVVDLDDVLTVALQEPELVHLKRQLVGSERSGGNPLFDFRHNEEPQHLGHRPVGHDHRTRVHGNHRNPPRLG